MSNYVKFLEEQVDKLQEQNRLLATESEYNKNKCFREYIVLIKKDDYTIISYNVYHNSKNLITGTKRVLKHYYKVDNKFSIINISYTRLVGNLDKKFILVSRNVRHNQREFCQIQQVFDIEIRIGEDDKLHVYAGHSFSDRISFNLYKKIEKQFGGMSHSRFKEMIMSDE